MITQLFLFIFVIYCAMAIEKKSAKKSLQILFVSGLIVALYAILQKAGLDPLFKNFDASIFVGRSFGSLGNPGYLGQFMMLILLVGGYLFASSKKRAVKTFYGLSIAVVLAALWFSQTRAAMLALTLCLLLLCVKHRKYIFNLIKKARRSWKVVFVVALVPVIIGIGIILQQDRFSLSEVGIRSMGSRLETWKGAISLIQNRPVLGYGAETFYVYAPEIITKKFLTLEENISLSIDRIHNEFLETVFSYGIFAGLIYLIFLFMLLKLFFKTKEPILVLFSILIVGNMIQNQFAFSDISISVFISFCIGGIIALQEKQKVKITSKGYSKYRHILVVVILIVFAFSFIHMLYKPFMSQLLYAKSKKNYNVSYEVAINAHKEAISYTPYYSKLWYDLIFVDPSSLERALYYLEKIEGETGNLLAWRGNFYSDSDPAGASEYYLKALEKNPYYPNWIRAYGDMLYKNGDYENALYLYKQYLEAVPDFWKWEESVYERSPEEQKSYRIFFKNVPDFWVTVERVLQIELLLGEKE